MKNWIMAVAPGHRYETDKILEKELLVMGLIKRNVIFNTRRFRRGENVYGRWKEKIPLKFKGI